MRAACLCFAGAGVVMAIWPLESSAHPAGEVRFIGIGCAALFGAIGLAGTLLARGPVRIEFLPDVLRWQIGAGTCSVAWQNITDVRAFDIRSTWFLAIDARPGSVRMPPGQRLLARANRVVACADASISLERSRRARPARRDDRGVRPRRRATAPARHRAEPRVARRPGAAFREARLRALRAPCGDRLGRGDARRASRDK